MSLCPSYVCPDRCAEALTMFKVGGSQRCPITDMIEYLPETYKVCLLARHSSPFRNVTLITCSVAPVGPQREGVGGRSQLSRLSRKSIGNVNPTSRCNQTDVRFPQIEYDFEWLQAPLEMQKKGDKSTRVQPLAALNVSKRKNTFRLERLISNSAIVLIFRDALIPHRRW